MGNGIQLVWWRFGVEKWQLADGTYAYYLLGWYFTPKSQFARRSNEKVT